MTLYRQLLLFLFLVLFSLLAGTWTIKLLSTRSFLEEQLGSHAQDTATSLGLSISTHAALDDTSAMETMVNAIFDRGYYSQIVVRDLQEQIALERNLNAAYEGVPAWFIRFIPLHTPVRTAFIMHGWQRLGSIQVQSHPGYAYQTLWRTVRDTSLWFILAGFLVAAVGSLILYALLRPLRRVEQQAQALCQRRYEIQEEIPKTRELRQMVEAMNRMTGKVRQMFEEQAAMAEQLRKNAYQDQLTGLGNRRFLDGQIGAQLSSRRETIEGSLLLLQVKGLNQLNQEKGFTAGDTLLLRVAEIISRTADSLHNGVACRLGGGDFALLLPDVDPEQSRLCAERITASCSQLHGLGYSLEPDVCHIGGALYHRNTTSGALLARADQALREAEQAGPNRYCLLAVASGAAPANRSTLLTLLQEALRQNTVCFLSQATHSLEPSGVIIHQELLARIPSGNDSLLPARMFIALAEQSGCSAGLDKAVVEAALRLDPAVFRGHRLALNLSPLSLEDRAFCGWLAGRLPSFAERGILLDVELAEYCALRQQDRLRELADQLHHAGQRLGIDNFGQGLTNFGYLHSLQPDYVKIERAFTNELLAASGDAGFFIGALCSVAHSLDIQVYAKGVENKEQLQLLRELHVDGVQGFHFGTPRPLTCPDPLASDQAERRFPETEGGTATGHPQP